MTSKDTPDDPSNKGASGEVAAGNLTFGSVVKDQFAQTVDRSAGGEFDGFTKAPSDKQKIVQTVSERPLVPSDSGLELDGRQVRYQTPWTVDPKTQFPTIVKDRNSESVPSEVRQAKSSVGSPEGTVPKTDTERRVSPIEVPTDRGRTVANAEASPISSTTPVATEKLTGTTIGSADTIVSTTDGSTPEGKADRLNPGDTRVIPAADPRLDLAKPGATKTETVNQNVREKSDTVLQPTGQAPGAGSVVRTELEKAKPLSSEVVPRVNGQPNADVLARSSLPAGQPNHVVEDPGVRNKVASAIPAAIDANARVPADTRAYGIIPDTPAPGHVNQIKSEVPGRIGVKSGGNVESGTREVSTQPTSKLPLADAAPTGDARVPTRGPAGTGDVGSTRPPEVRGDGGKVPTSINDGGKISDGTSPSEGTKVPPKVSQIDGSGKPITTAPGDGVRVPPIVGDGSGQKIPGQNAGVKTTDGKPDGGTKSDGVKTPPTRPDVGSDKTQGAGSSKLPPGTMVNDGKVRVPEPGGAGTKGIGSKADSTKVDPVSDGKTSKILPPTPGTKVDGRTPSGERPDPRAGKEKATPQVDPGSHSESGRTNKGPRETESATKTPVKRGDSHDPAVPTGPGDRTGKSDVGARGEKQGMTPSIESGGKGSLGDGKAPDGGRKQNQLGDKEPAGTKGPAGAKEGTGVRRPETNGATDGASSRINDASGLKGTAATKGIDGAGGKAGEGSRNPEQSGVKADGSRIPQAGGKVGESSRTPEPSGAKSDGSRIPAAGVNAGEGLRIPEPPGPKADSTRPTAGAKASESARNPETPGAKADGSRIPTASGKADHGSVNPEIAGKEVRKPIEGKVGDPITPPSGGINFGASEQGAFKPIPGAQKGSGLETGAPKVPGQKSSFTPIVGSDQKTTPGLKDRATSKKAELTDKQSKLDASKSESNRPSPQSKLPGILIERGLPSIAKPQPDRTRGDRAVVVKPDSRQPAGVDNPIARTPPLRQTDSARVTTVAAELTKYIAQKLDAKRPLQTEINSRPVEATGSLTLARRIASVLELIVPAKVIELVRVAPVLNLEAPGDVPSDTVPHSIRDVFRKFQLALPKRTFSPEITESGSYVAQRGQSSQRLQAFISSGQHKALRSESMSESPHSRKFYPGTKDDEVEEETDNEVESDSNTKQANSADVMFAKPASTAGAGHHAQHGSVRKMYVVQAGDTPRSIAVVQLNDHLLENLIVEINKLVFLDMYDSRLEKHVKVLPVGAMILLPNKRDIESFRDR